MKIKYFILAFLGSFFGLMPNAMSQSEVSSLPEKSPEKTDAFYTGEDGSWAKIGLDSLQTFCLNPEINGVVVFSITSNGDAKIQHIVAGTTAPAITPGTSAGVGATASITGHDIGGNAIINATTTAGNNIFVGIQFNKQYLQPPSVVISPANSMTAGMIARFFVVTSNIGFEIRCTGTAPTANAIYSFNYIVVG